MIRSLAPLALLSCVALAACSTDSSEETSTTVDNAIDAPAVETVLDQNLPFDAMPEVPEGKNGWVECPYLDSQFVADTNGQRMMAVGIDERFDTPACVFWSYEESPQVQVLVRHMPTAEDARAVVDWAAPVDSTSRADEPLGWTGGRKGDEEGAVYAVQKDNVAVVVWSDQQQSVKASNLAVATIENLGL
ncbi:MAG: DUF2020 domain-containing protein [Corynebacterium sp.]|nr:DUF2020 domain-containing protein [Corynebacterium sp.]